MVDVQVVLPESSDLHISGATNFSLGTAAEVEGGSEGAELELRCPVGAISGPDSANGCSWMSEALARFASAPGYAQVTVYLKPKS